MDYKKYVRVNQKFIRPNEPQKLCGDSSKAQKILNWKPSLSFTELINEIPFASAELMLKTKQWEKKEIDRCYLKRKYMQFIDLKSRQKLIGDKINARIQKVMDHGQFILGPEVRSLNRNSLNTQVLSIA